MDSIATLTNLGPAVTRFAARLRDELGAERVMLFGPYVCGVAAWDDDYGFIIVAERFASIPPLQRTVGIHDLFYHSGGDGSLQLFCVTNGEMEHASTRGAYFAAFVPEAIDLLPPPNQAK